MNKTHGGKWLVTNTQALYGRHSLCVWVVAGGKWRWTVADLACRDFVSLADGVSSTLHAARVAAKRASARLQGKAYSGVRAA